MRLDLYILAPFLQVFKYQYIVDFLLKLLLLFINNSTFYKLIYIINYLMNEIFNRNYFMVRGKHLVH